VSLRPGPYADRFWNQSPGSHVSVRFGPPGTGGFQVRYGDSTGPREILCFVAKRPMLRSLSIQSKLILFLLSVALLTGLPIAYLGYRSGRDAIEKSVIAQLEGQRRTRGQQTLRLLETMKKQVVTLSANHEVIDALERFEEAFDGLQAKRGTPLLEEAEVKTLEGFYTRVIMPGLEANSDSKPMLATIYPTDPVTQYLQYQYIAKTEPPYLRKDLVESAGIDTDYDRVHRDYHPNLSGFAREFGFEDLMLVDLDGNIVYTAQKTIEFGTNLEQGPYEDTNLGELYRRVRRLRERDSFEFADFERYKPNLNTPSAFVGSPIFSRDAKFVGILIFQFPIEELTRVLTGGFQWQKEGLGETGEVYLVGRDETLRSRSRILYGESFPEGLAALRRAGISDSILKVIERQKNGLLALEVRTEGVKQALAGDEGIATYYDYRGELVLGSYAPFDFGSTRWALLAEMDTAEANAPIQSFGRRVMITTAGIALATTLLGLLLSNLFVAPVRTLTTAARRIAAGEVGAQAEVNTRDEFRDLADAFNDMSRGLKEKTQQLQQKVRENEELLLNILPAPAAARLREGDANPTQSFGDVTVLFAEVVGLLELTDKLGPERGLKLLHDLVVAFDESADQLGVEKVKTSGASYLAVCGLSVQRPDHTSRVVEFAQELRRIVDRFNRERGSDLGLVVGINAGPVTGGVVGRNKFIYDLWGETVSVARGLRRGQTDGVWLTRTVYDRVTGQYPLGECEVVEIPGRGSVESWSLKPVAS